MEEVVEEILLLLLAGAVLGCIVAVVFYAWRLM
jgi:hypothetical protein